MTKLIEWTCEGDPKAASASRRQREASPLSSGHASHSVRDRVGFAVKANVGGTAGLNFLSLQLLKGHFFISKSHRSARAQDFVQSTT